MISNINKNKELVPQPQNVETMNDKERYVVVTENNNNNLNLQNNNNNKNNVNNIDSQNNVTKKVEREFSIYNGNINYYECYNNNAPLTEMPSTQVPAAVRLIGRPVNNKIKPPTKLSVATTTAIISSSTAIATTKDNTITTNNINNNNNVSNRKSLNSNNIDNPNSVNTNDNYDSAYVVNGKDHLKNIHNYSKLPEESIEKDMVGLKTAFNQKETDESHDDYDDYNAEEKIASNSDDKMTPDHHARRPMNAFLIFCKRHRTIVREKYPNLENRSITKILGDWWSNLGEDDKQCFTNLAKQYKDAFFNANPSFKWYKLPAPARRTLSTRPGNAERLHVNAVADYHVINNNNNANSNNNNLDNNYKHIGTDKKSSMGKFKLADESEMGTLNSLWMKNDDKESDDNNLMGEENVSDDATPRQSNAVPASLDSSAYLLINAADPLSNMKNHAAKMQMTKNNKRKHEVDHSADNHTPAEKKFANDMAHNRTDWSADGYDDDESKKSSRSCKGKRYQEFMTSGKVATGSKKPRNSSAEFAAFNSQKQKGTNQSPDGIAAMLSAAGDQKMDLNKDEVDAGKGGDTKMDNLMDDSQKLYDASDFDLEDKITSLPCLSLENYLSKKRETKKKKKINNKSKSPNVKPVSTTIQEEKEKIKGSQKRKARKESITRRDIKSIANIVDEIQKEKPVQELSQTQIKVDANNTDRVEETHSSGACDTADLFGLATLAEVAAKEYKIDNKAAHQQL